MSTNVLLGGCSAGALASLLNCGNLEQKLPESANLKCFSDGGIFLDTTDVLGNRTLRSMYKALLNFSSWLSPFLKSSQLLS